ncbi:MAG: Ig-like domain-containing protein, partial [Nocardioidaceae bacterium]
MRSAVTTAPAVAAADPASTRRKHRRARGLTRRGLVLAGAVPVLAATAALAAWLSTGTGSGSAAAASLTAPPVPTAVYDLGAVRLTWSAVTMPDGAAVDSYDVIRHVGGNTLVVCTATAPSTTCTDDNPLVGTVTYGVVARKGFNWVGPESATKSFVSDQTKPVTTASVSPTPNGAGWNNAAVTVTLTATDTGGSGVKNITYSVDGAAGVVVAGASTSFTESSDGTHTITYYARDFATNVETTKSLTVKIDTAAPDAPTFTSISADTGASSTDQVTKTTAQTLSGTAEPGSTVIVKRGTTTMSTVTANASGIFTTTSLNLVAGVNSFTATSTDSAGNVSAVSATFPVTLDTSVPAKPVLTGISNDTGVSTTDEITNVATQVVSGTAEAGSEVTVKQTVPSTATLGTSSTDGSGAFTFAMDFTPNQATTITATATDLAGNISTASTGLVVKVDQIAPTTTVNSITPAPNAAGWNRATTAVVIGQTDAGTGGTDKLYTRLNAAAFTSVTTATKSVSVTTAVQGDNTVAYYAVDKAGNVGDSGSVVVKMDSVAPAKPVITGISNDTGTSSTDRITNAAAQTLSGTAEANSTVMVIRGGATIATGTASGTGSYAIPITLVEGVNSLTVKATDVADNVSAASTALTVTLDTTMADPAFTGISNDTGSSSNDQITTVA